MKSNRNFWTSFVYLLGLILFILGISINLWGAYVESDFKTIDLHKLFIASYGNIGVGLIDTAITILVIDTLYRKREEHSHRETLFRQLRSTDNLSALQALEDLFARGWLKRRYLIQHTYYGANLSNAQLLSGLDMSNARMSGANLTNVNLLNTKLNNAILNDTIFVEGDLISTQMKGANLVKANFENAILQSVDFRGAVMNGANFHNAKLDGLIFDSETILPDGTRWKPEVDIQVFARDSTR